MFWIKILVLFGKLTRRFRAVNELENYIPNPKRSTCCET